LHVDDAALAFAHVIGKAHCIGQTYHLVDRGFITWADYHRTAMRVLGREVELVGVPLADLRALNVPHSEICCEVFAHHGYYSAEKLFRDVPEFRPMVSLEQGMQAVIDAMDRAGRIPNADLEDWEDRIIAAQRRIRTAFELANTGNSL
jgi:nucleoside-diphosphate-sugar epimerase